MLTMGPALEINSDVQVGVLDKRSELYLEMAKMAQTEKRDTGKTGKYSGIPG